MSHVASGPQREDVELRHTTEQGKELGLTVGTRHKGLILQILHIPACFPLNRNPNRTGTTEKHVAGEASSTRRPQDTAEMRAAG